MIGCRISNAHENDDINTDVERNQQEWHPTDNQKTKTNEKRFVFVVLSMHKLSSTHQQKINKCNSNKRRQNKL